MFTASPLNRWIDVEIITSRVLGSQPWGRKACWVGGRAPSCPSFHHSLSYKHAQTHQHTEACIHKKGHTHAFTFTLKSNTQCKRHTWKSLRANTLHTYAYAICRTSPSQPEDKGAVVARQQVFLAPTHLEAASAPTISQWLPTSSWSHTPCSTPKDKKGKKDSLMEPRTQTELDVGGDRYSDLLLCAECKVVNVQVDLQLRHN